MRRSVENIVLRGSMAKGLQFSIYFVNKIMLVPVFLMYWGAEKYGVWLTVFSFFNLLLAIDKGHGNFVSNEFTRYYHTDATKAQEVLGSAIRAAFMSGVIQMVIITLIALFDGFDILLGGEEIAKAGAIAGVYALVAYRTVLGSIKGIVIKVINPTGHIDRAMHIGTGEKVLDICVLLAAGFSDWSVFMLCIALAITKAAYSVFVFILIKRWVPEIFPWWKAGGFKLGIRNYIKAIPLTMSHFLDNFRTDGINLLVSSVLGPVLLPVITTVRTLANLASRITIIMLTPLQPELTRYHFSGQGDKIVQAIKANWLISGLVINAPFVILAYFVPNLYEVWTSGKIVFDEVLYISFVTSILLLNYGSGYIYYLRAINHIQGLFIISLMRALLLFGLTWILLQTYGLIGVGIAMIISELITAVNIPGYFAKSAISGLGVKIPVASRLLAILAIITIVAFLVVDHYVIDSSYMLGLVTLGTLAALTFMQWRQLSIEVKYRLMRVVHSLGSRFGLKK